MRTRTCRGWLVGTLTITLMAAGSAGSHAAEIPGADAPVPAPLDWGEIRADPDGDRQVKGAGEVDPLIAEPMAAPTAGDAARRAAWRDLKAAPGGDSRALTGRGALSSGPERLAGGADRAPAPAPQAVTCPVGALGLGTPVNGNLGASACRLPQVMIDETRGSFADQYLLETAARGRLTVTAGRQDFAPYLAVLDEQYNLLASSTSAGADAAIDILVPQGRFIVVVSAAAGGVDQGGAYTLSADLAPTPSAGNCQAAMPLTPGTPQQAALGDRDCRLFDIFTGVFRDPFVQVYTFELDEAGALALQATGGALHPLLVLADADFVPFAVSGTSGATTTQSEVHLGPGSYRLVVSSITAGQGSVALETAFTPAASDCAPEDKPLVGTIEGALAEGDCRMAYLPAGSRDQSRVDLYRVVAPQSGLMVVSLEAEGFQPALRIFNPLFETKYGPIEAPEGLDTIGAQVTAAPNTYLLAVEVAGNAAGMGNYSLTLGFQALDVDCSVETLAPTGSADGSLGLEDCSLRGAGLGNANSRVDQYRVTVAERGILSVSLNATGFSPFLAAYSDAMKYMSSVSPDQGPAELELVVYPGTYVLLATSQLPAAGNYRISTRFQRVPPPANCPIKPIGPTATVNGDLSAASCRVFDVMPGYPVQEHTDRYRLTLTQRGRVTIAQTSIELDSFLDLYDADYNYITHNDDANPPELDSEIEVLLPPGEYIIHATTVGVSTGAYRLTTRFQAEPAPDPCPIDTLLPDASRPERLATANACLALDWLAAGGGYSETPLDVYRLHLPQQGTLTLDLSALAFDPALGVFDPNWVALAANDDRSDIDLDSRLELQDWPPGFYLVVATTSDGDGGDYLLETAFEPLPFNPGEGTPTPTPVTPEHTPTPRPTTPTPVATTPGPIDGNKVIFLPCTVRNGNCASEPR